MNLSSFTQLTGRVSRLALLALAVSLSGIGHAKEQWHVYDVLGNTVASVDADAVVAEVESTAFGESRTPTAGARFTGKPYDADLSAHVFPFRNYRSDSGRWTSADPSGFPDGVNASAYAPNPNFQVDPMGLWTLSLVSGQSLPANSGGVSGPFSNLSGSYRFVTNANLAGSSTSGTNYDLTASGGAILQKDAGGWYSFSSLVSIAQSMTVSVSSTGNITVVPAQTGTTSNSDSGLELAGNLVIGSLVAIDSTTNQLTISYTTQANYNTDAIGVTVGPAGISWANPAHLSASRVVSVTFEAVE